MREVSQSVVYTKPMMQTVVVGACVLASGGGGSFQVSRKLVDQGVAPNATVTVVDISDIPADDSSWMLVAANMGSPDALFKTTNPYASTNALLAMQNYMTMMKAAGLGVNNFNPFQWVLAFEVGSINLATPFAVAAQRGLKLIDGDGAGRSVPVLYVVTFTDNLNFYPATIAADAPPGAYYDSAVFNILDVVMGETALIDVLADENGPFKGIGGLGVYPTSGQTLAQQANLLPVLGSVTYASEIGNAMAAQTGQDRVIYALRTFNFRPQINRQAGQIFYGQVTYMTQGSGGVDYGKIQLTDGAGNVLTIYNANENVYAFLNRASVPFIMGPDSIGYITPTGDPVDNSDLYQLYQAGQRPNLYVIGIQADPKMKAQKVVSNWEQVYTTIQDPDTKQYPYQGPYVPWSPTQEEMLGTDSK